MRGDGPAHATDTGRGGDSRGRRDPWSEMCAGNSAVVGGGGLGRGRGSGAYGAGPCAPRGHGDGGCQAGGADRCRAGARRRWRAACCVGGRVHRRSDVGRGARAPGPGHRGAIRAVSCGGCGGGSCASADDPALSSYPIAQCRSHTRRRLVHSPRPDRRRAPPAPGGRDTRASGHRPCARCRSTRPRWVC